MAGQVYGKIECSSLVGGADPEQKYAQEIFKGLYDFLAYLESQNVVTIRSSYFGDTGSGTGYHDEANPFKTNAWVLAEWRTSTTSPANPTYAGTRSQPFYIFAQFARADEGAFASAGSGSPVLFKGGNIASGEAGVGIQMAVGVGGDLNPWNGTLAAGTGAKGNPVWKVPASGGTGVYVFPRSNSGSGATAGSHVASRQNLVGLYNPALSNGTANRYHFIADHDGLLILIDDGGDNVFGLHYSGVYAPRPGLTGVAPFIQINSTSLPLSTGTGTLYGDYTGTSSLNGGIAFNGAGTPEVRSLVLSRLDEMLSGSEIQPNRLFATPTYDEMPLLCGVRDVVSGWAGTIDLFREIQNVANQERNPAGTKLIVGDNFTSSVKAIIPWNSAVTPLSGSTRGGTTGAF